MSQYTHTIKEQENIQADWIMHRDMLINQLTILQNKINFASSQVERLNTLINNLKLNSHENYHKNATNWYHNRSEQK